MVSKPDCRSVDWGFKFQRRSFYLNYFLSDSLNFTNFLIKSWENSNDGITDLCRV